MACIYCGLELVKGKIRRAHTGIEGAQTKIDGIRSFTNSCVERLLRSCRRKQFNFLHSILISFNGALVQGDEIGGHDN
ncbi:MAG: hypothetical protein BWX81_01607 [Spirochaetes bacterium ADurb.Bin110]|nr:MAG: hypothetical protein BWX81_01607 [Spirochaetes bacterium ADurb.Bin110]